MKYLDAIILGSSAVFIRTYEGAGVTIRNVGLPIFEKRWKCLRNVKISFCFANYHFLRAI